MNCYDCKFCHKAFDKTDKILDIYFCREMGKIIPTDLLSEGCGEWLSEKTKWYDRKEADKNETSNSDNGTERA